MTAKILFIKHIHSTFASASSSDSWVGLELDKANFPHIIQEPDKPNADHDFFSLLAAAQSGNKIDTEKRVEKEGSIISFPGSPLDGEYVNGINQDPEYPQYMIVYMKSDRTFYEKGLHSKKGIFGNGYHETPEFKELVASYIEKGWIDDYETEDTKAFRKFNEDKELYQRSEEELVLWNYGKDDFDVSQYQGGFSDELYQGDVQKYCEAGAVFGWMGDLSTRTRDLDKYIEAEFVRRQLSLDPLRVWLTSSDARHYAESLCGENQTQQEMQIKNYINSIYNLGVIYGDKRHQGTYDSTKELRAVLEEEGKLIQETKEM